MINLSRTAFLTVIVLLILTAGAGFWYWQRNTASTAPVTKTLGGHIFDKTQNPTQDAIPQTNPYSVKTNVFEKSETNPLKNVYQNPF